MVEAPDNEARSLAVIAEAAKLVPGKPIRYVVNTHHHFDHAGGLRTYLSQGTTIVTHESNKEYYLDILFHPAPRTLQPDRMAHLQPDVHGSAGGRRRSKRCGEPQYAITMVTDGERILEIIHVQDMAYELGDPSYRQGNHSAGHADRLPAEGEDPAQRRPVLAARRRAPRRRRRRPACEHAAAEHLKLKLDVERSTCPSTAASATNDEFLKMFPKN